MQAMEMKTMGNMVPMDMMQTPQNFGSNVAFSAYIICSLMLFSAFMFKSNGSNNMSFILCWLITTFFIALFMYYSVNPLMAVEAPEIFSLISFSAICTLFISSGFVYNA